VICHTRLDGLALREGHLAATLEEAYTTARTVWGAIAARVLQEQRAHVERGLQRRGQQPILGVRSGWGGWGWTRKCPLALQALRRTRPEGPGRVPGHQKEGRPMSEPDRPDPLGACPRQAHAGCPFVGGTRPRGGDHFSTI
jgi:hypothetical protein